MAEQITSAGLREFLLRKLYSVIHFDTAWDGYKKSIQEKIESLQLAYRDEVSFGFVDCDTEQELAGEAGILNVPCIAYYRGTNLVARVIGVKQDISGNIGKMMRGEMLDTSNIFSRK